jgi:hypothetical protein
MFLSWGPIEICQMPKTCQQSSDVLSPEVRGMDLKVGRKISSSLWARLSTSVARFVSKIADSCDKRSASSAKDGRPRARKVLPRTCAAVNETSPATGPSGTTCCLPVSNPPYKHMHHANS